MSNPAEKLPVTPELMQRAMAVGPHASIQSIRLANVNAMLGVVQIDSKPKFVRNKMSHSFSRVGDKGVEVSIRFGLDIATTDDEKSEPPIAIEARYLLNYEIDTIASFNDEHLTAFAQVNGYFNAWPFWRELSTSMLARTQAGFFLLPTLRVEVPSLEAATSESRS